MPNRILFALALTVALTRGLAAQAADPPVARADSICTYSSCGLGLAPSLISLDVVRGARAERVARLGFLWPGEVRPLFAGSDSAVAFAGRAVRTRRRASVLTDAGLLLLGGAAIVAAKRGEIDRTGAGLGAGGLALLAASYPVQLRADEHLSKAVWWYNTRFTR